MRRTQRSTAQHVVVFLLFFFFSLMWMTPARRYCHLLEGAVSSMVELLDQRAWPHKTEVCRCLRNLALGSPSLQRGIVERGCARYGLA